MPTESENPGKTRVPLEHTHRATEHLAAERTFLAWVRTSIAVMSLGFVVAKFSVWLRELAGRIDPRLQTEGSGMSLPVGLTMIAAGALMVVLAARRYHVLNRAIEAGEVEPDRWLVLTVTVIVAAVGLAMITYMLVNVWRL